MPYPFIESPHQTAASGRAIGVVVIHTMEIAERAGAAEVCAQWFENPASEVSAHYCVDADSIVQCVREEDIAWHARGGNANSIGIELAGYAGPASARLERRLQPGGRRAGRAAHGRRLRAARDPAAPPPGRGSGRGQARHHGHADVSAAFRKSDHWDPGPDFPWTRFLRLARSSDVVERATQA